MAQNGKTTVGHRAKGGAQSRKVAQKGVRTGKDFANLMSGLMSDLIEGRIDAVTANAVCNAGGKLLKMVEMENKYARNRNRTKEETSLMLAHD